MMEVIADKAAMRAWSRSARRAGKRIALVPTMGSLHAGHLSLVRVAQAHADIVVVSIYVNPTQFDQPDDLAAYPAALQADAALLEAEGVAALFAPESMYVSPPQTHETWVEVTTLTDRLCGQGRPGHFRGVTTVVTKLFNVVEPDVAVFGDKDFQQRRVIERMVRDLDVPVAIIAAPLLRDADGLALSSRNARLSADGRQRALSLSRALREAAAAAAGGQRDPATLRAAVRRQLEDAGGEVAYVAIVEEDSLTPAVSLLTRPARLLAAACFDGVRLIDNIAL